MALLVFQMIEKSIDWKSESFCQCETVILLLIKLSNQIAIGYADSF